MARRTTSLKIVLNGRLVGWLTRQRSGAIDFRYDRAWLEWENAIPVSLSMPLQESGFFGDAVTAVFDGLLPDDMDMRREIAARIGAQGSDAFSLLSVLGRDCIGALQFLHADDAIPEVGTIRGEPVNDSAIARILNELASAPLGMNRDDEFRISLAGAQEKTALLFHQGQWMKPLGATPTTHILKPQIGRVRNMDLSDSVENEFLCLKLCAAFGLPVNEAVIRDFDGVRALVITRFDRLWTDGRLLRVPQEDCCQALSVPPSLKYQRDGGPGMRDVLDLLTASDDPALDRLTFLRAQIVFWLLGATDGHAKNFSLFLAPGGGFRMTPLYDVLSAQQQVDANVIPHNDFKLAMSADDNNHYVMNQIGPRHFRQTAAAAGMAAGAIDDYLEELGDRALQIVDETGAGLPDDFPENVLHSVRGGIAARLRDIHAWIKTRHEDE